MPVGWVDAHVEYCCAHAGKKTCNGGNCRLCIDLEHVFVGETELDLRIPGPAQSVFPMEPIELHDETGGRLRNTFKIRPRQRKPTVGGHDFLEDCRRPIAGEKSRCIHATAIWCNGQSTGCIC